MIKQDIEKLWKANRTNELGFKIAFIDSELEQIDTLINNLRLAFDLELSWVDGNCIHIEYDTQFPSNCTASLAITIIIGLGEEISYSFYCSTVSKSRPICIYATTINELINNINDFVKE